MEFKFEQVVSDETDFKFGTFHIKLPQLLTSFKESKYDIKIERSYRSFKYVTLSNGKLLIIFYT